MCWLTLIVSSDLYHSALREFQRIFDQVHQHLFEPALVSHQILGHSNSVWIQLGHLRVFLENLILLCHGLLAKNVANISDDHMHVKRCKRKSKDSVA